MKKVRVVSAVVCASILFCFATQGIFASPPGPNNKDLKGGGERSSVAVTKLPIEIDKYRNVAGPNGPDFSSAIADKGDASNAINIPVILIAFPAGTPQGNELPATSFSDQSTIGTDDGSGSAYREYYRDLMETSTTSLTMKEYYRIMSQNNFNLHFEFFGPYTAAHSYEYYGAHIAKIKDISPEIRDIRPGELVQEAVKALIAANPNIDYKQFDNDNNGKVDSVIVIHAGPDEAQNESTGPNYIWSHQNSLRYTGAGLAVTYPNTPHDPVIFDDYTIQAEHIGAKPGNNTIGTLCHEFGHALGLPDLYNTENTGMEGVGNWSLMSGGSNLYVPGPLLAWERNNIGGDKWVTLEEITTSREVQVDDLEVSHKAYKIWLNDKEFLVVEGKKANTDDKKPTQKYTGILISQYNQPILDTVPGGNNDIQIGNDKVHAVNILEAGTNHNAKGLGLLWQQQSAERTGLSDDDYQKMLFPAGKINSIKDYSTDRNAAYPFVIPVLPRDKWLLAMILPAIAAFILVIIRQKKKRLILITGFAIVSMAALVSCPVVTNSAQIPDRRDLPFAPRSSDATPGGDTGVTKLETTSYYLNDDVTSKKGISGVTITIPNEVSFPMTVKIEINR